MSILPFFNIKSLVFSRAYGKSDIGIHSPPPKKIIHFPAPLASNCSHWTKLWLMNCNHDYSDFQDVFLQEKDKHPLPHSSTQRQIYCLEIQQPSGTFLGRWNSESVTKPNSNASHLPSRQQSQSLTVAARPKDLLEKQPMRRQESKPQICLSVNRRYRGI